jgi:hypothetical protein
MYSVTSAGKNGLETSNTVCNTDMCTVMHAENGSRELSIVRDLYKELDVTGIRNVHSVKLLDTTNE